MRMGPGTLADITYAAFQTHYNATKGPDWSTAEEHWLKNRDARLLWSGLVRGVIINCCVGQQNGTIKFDPDPGRLVVPPAPSEAEDAITKGIEKRLADALTPRGPHMRLPQAAKPEGVPPGLAIERQDCTDE